MKKTYPLKGDLAAFERELQEWRSQADDRSGPIVAHPLPEPLARQALQLVHTLAAHRGEALYRKPQQRFAQLINNMSNAELNEVLYHVAESRIEGGGDGSNLLQSCLDVLKLNRMRELICYKHRQMHHLAEEAQDVKAMAAEIAEFLSKGDIVAEKDPAREQKVAFLQRVANFFQSFATTFSQAHDFSIEDEPAYDRAEANDRLTNFYSLVEKPLKIFQIALTIAAIAVPQIAVPILIASIVTLSFIVLIFLAQRYSAKAPPVLSNGFQNLTLQAERGHLRPVVARSAQVQKLVECLGGLDGNGRRPLLIGKSGVGKTEIVHALAQEIADGKHPSLRDKQVYSINTGALLDPGAGRNGRYYTRLQTLLRDIKGKEDRVILFFDEAQALFGRGSSRGPATLPEQFKLLLDNPKVNCIAATTDGNYKRWFTADRALARRFRTIEVEELNQEDCLNVLRDLVARDYPEVSVSEEAYQKVLTLTARQKGEVAQVAMAKDLLLEAIHAVRLYRGPEALELETLQAELDRQTKELEYARRISITSPTTRTILQRLRTTRDRINEVESRVAERVEAIETLGRLKQEKKRWQQRYVNLAHSLQDSDSSSRDNDNMAKAFLFLGDYMLETIDQRIQAQEQVLRRDGLPTEVDSAMIQRLSSDQQRHSCDGLRDFLRSLRSCEPDNPEPPPEAVDHAPNSEPALEETESDGEASSIARLINGTSAIWKKYWSESQPQLDL